MRIFLLHIACVSVLFLYAQDSTQVLSTITILRDKGQTEQILLNTELLKINSGLSFADLLQKQSGVFVRRQGPTTLATFSYRGLGSMHTPVYIAGQNMQSSMNGIIDLNLISSYHFNSITETDGILSGSANLGRSFLLDSKGGASGFDWTFGRDWWGRSSLGTRIACHQKNLNYKLSVFALKDPHNPEQFPESAPKLNGNTRSISAYQSLDWDINKKLTYHNRVYLVSAHRSLPSLGLSPSDARQFDHHLVISNKLSSKGISGLALEHVFWKENINYDTDLADIHARHQALNSSIYLSFSQKPSRNNSVQMIYEVGHRYTGYESTMLQSFKTFNRPFINFKWEYEIRNWTLKQSNGLLYSEFGPAYSGNLEVLRHGKQSYWSFKQGRNYRLPVLNELYWYEPGYAFGNPLLQPETGTSFELCYTQTIQSLLIKLSSFAGLNRNLIEWRQSGVLQAQNVNNSWIAGAQIKLLYRKKTGLNEIKVQANAAYTEARYGMGSPGTAEGNQLIYTPRFTGNVSTSFSAEYLGAYVNGLVISKNYYRSDNLAYLNPYFLLDCGIYAEYEGIRSSISVMNSLNARYSTVPGYLMPKTTINIQINYHLEFKKNEKNRSTAP